MMLVTAPVDTNFAGLAEIPAGTRVVIPADAAAELRRDLTREHLPLRVSGLGHYTRRYGGQDLAGKHLLVWRGHGVGDQLIVAGLLRILKLRYPTARIDFLAHPRITQILWSGADTLDPEDSDPIPFTPVPEPMSFDQWKTYDYHWILDDMCESDLEPDQPCTWDGMLTSAGIDPADVPACMKRPYCLVTDTDRLDAAAWLRACGIDLDTPLILWQLAASTEIRSYHPEPTRQALRLIASRHPEAVIILIGNHLQQAQYEPLAVVPTLWENFSGRLRTTFALAEQAAVCVAPDSMLNHVAEALGTPAVGLWSSFHPRDRVQHYASHHPLYQPASCGHGPCRIHECGDQPPGCPVAMRDPLAHPWGRYCRGLAEIAPERIADAVDHCLDVHPKQKAT